jgi:hypothetical protein
MLRKRSDRCRIVDHRAIVAYAKQDWSAAAMVDARAKIMGTSREMLDLRYDNAIAMTALQWMEQKRASEHTTAQDAQRPGLTLDSPSGLTLQADAAGAFQVTIAG